jgi:ribonuclease T2
MSMHRTRTTLLAHLVTAALILGLARPASAQGSPGRPGDFDYYALVLSWSPTYCADQGSRRANDLQCSAKRPYAFVLHGLWPQYARGYPESCRTDFNPRVPQSVIDSMLDIMPSPGLVIHEYRKHGTCSGFDPKSYYALSRRLFAKISIPEKFREPTQPITTNPGDIARAFADANPGLKPDMLGVACGRGSRMREVRICFSRDGAFRSCGANETPERLCRSRNVVLPPVRGG